MSTFPGLDSQLELGPTYAYEYNTRETYGKTIQDWGANDPLNATWWHRVTEGECIRCQFNFFSRGMYSFNLD